MEGDEPAPISKLQEQATAKVRAARRPAAAAAAAAVAKGALSSMSSLTALLAKPAGGSIL